MCHHVSKKSRHSLCHGNNSPCGIFTSSLPPLSGLALNACWQPRRLSPQACMTSSISKQCYWQWSAKFVRGTVQSELRSVAQEMHRIPSTKQICLSNELCVSREIYRLWVGTPRWKIHCAVMKVALILLRLFETPLSPPRVLAFCRNPIPFADRNNCLPLS